MPSTASSVGRAVIGAALVLALSAHAARAADYHVAPGGSDAATGVAGAPWATIAHAAAAVAAGDTVHVAPGTYTDGVLATASGTAAARIVFVSDVRWGAKIDTTAYSAWENDGDYVDIVGFDIRGTGCTGIYNHGSNVRTIGNHVHDIAANTCGTDGGAGIVNYNLQGHDSNIIGNVVHGIGTGPAASSLVHGIYHANLRGHIFNNISYGNVGWGIHTWHVPADVVIANNLIFGNLHGGILVGAGDDPGAMADGFLVINNIVIHNELRAGIIEGGITGTHNVYLNNLVYGNPVGAFALQNGNTASGTLTVDPLLVDYRADGTGNYHLTAQSPCINAGVAMGAPSDDADGVARPQGGAWDIGPFEWSSPVIAPDAGVPATNGGMPPGDAGAATDAGLSHDAGLSPDVATAGTNGVTGSCGCHVAGAGAPPVRAMVVLALAALLRGRRRRG